MIIKRFSGSSALVSLFLPFVFYSAFAFVLGYLFWPYFYYIKSGTAVVLGAFAIWRYGWQLTHYCRSAIFRFYSFPALRKRATNLPEHQKYPENIFFIIPSYNEEAWVSIEAFHALFTEISDVPSNAIIIVATGSDADDKIISTIYEAHPVKDKVTLVFQRQSQGKRMAMGHALRCASRYYNKLINVQDDVVVLMDGDSYLEPGSLKKILPFFSSMPKLGALTTNEIAYIATQSNWYKSWFNLKFGQRHILFQSHSLSKKVLTLTGRFSVLRASIVMDEEFIRQIECDIMTHWRHGKFRFLMGDDKSTWYYLLKHGWEMLYVPDVLCYSLESRDAPFFELSLSLPYRWYGNTLRNNDRALAIGWRKTGLFIWICILDQRLSMWTALVGITGASMLAVGKSFIFLPLYISWVVMVRVMQLTIISIYGHPVNMRTIPLMLYNQWIGAFIKIHSFFHLSSQKWSKGKNTQRKDNNCVMIEHPLVRWMPMYCMIFFCVVFFTLLLVSQNILQVPDIYFFSRKVQASHAKVPDYKDNGIIPNDGKDDSGLINTIINNHDGKDVLTIKLPPGVIDIFSPVIFNRDNIVFKGTGKEKTALRLHLKKADETGLQIIGSRGKKIGKLSGKVIASQSVLLADLKEPLSKDDIILIKKKNSNSFFDDINSVVWRRKFPEIRQTMVMVNRKSKDNKVYLARSLGIDFSPKNTSLHYVNAVKNVWLEDFSIEFLVDGHDINEVKGKYENLFPEFAVDTILFKWAYKCGLKNIGIFNSGRHALVFENSLRCFAQSINISGSWNKGVGGSGYLRLSRSHYCRMKNMEVKDIRHITIQWSSSYNVLSNVRSMVDINYHGGGEHNNIVENSELLIPEYHPFKAVYITGNRARWAPPSGQNNYFNGELQHP